MSATADDTLAASQNHSRGEPTLLGASEGQDNYVGWVDQILGYAKTGADIYRDFTQSPEDTVKKQAKATGEESLPVKQILLWGGIGFGVLLILLVILRRR
jgi:hypothetical protein